MGKREDWIRSMGGNPARYRGLELPPLIVHHPKDEFIEMRCVHRGGAPTQRKQPDALQARSTGATSFGGGRPDRAEGSLCEGTRHKVLTRTTGFVRGYDVQCMTCNRTSSIRY